MPSCLLFAINLDFMNLIFLDIVIKNASLFTNIMSSDKVTFVYLSCIYVEIPTRVTIATDYSLIVVFPLVILWLAQICHHLPWCHI